jgi:hypothetical protein
VRSWRKHWKQQEKNVVTKKKIDKCIRNIFKIMAWPENMTEEGVFIHYQTNSHMQPKHYHKCKAYIAELLPQHQLNHLLTKGK